MEPKSVNTTVSSVLQIAAGPTSPDGAESSALDFAQVILASQGNSGAGEEQHQGRNGSNGVEDTNHKLSSDDTLAVSGDPLALKIFRPKPGVSNSEDGAGEGLEPGTSPQITGPIKAVALDVSEPDVNIDRTVLSAGPNVILADAVELIDDQQPLGVSVATVETTGDPTSDAGEPAAPSALAAVSKLEPGQDLDPAVAIDEDNAVVVAPNVNLNTSMQNTAQVAAGSENQTSAQASNVSNVSAVVTSPSISDADRAVDSVVVKDGKQAASMENPGKLTVTEPAVASSDISAVAKPVADTGLVEKPIQKITADGLAGAADKQSPKENSNQKEANNVAKHHADMQSTEQGQRAVTASVDRPMSAQAPMVLDEDGAVKAADLAVKKAEGGVKVPDAGLKANEVGAQSEKSQQIRADGRSVDANQAFASTNVRPAPAEPMASLESETKPIVTVPVVKTAPATVVAADAAPVAASQGQKVAQVDSAQKSMASQTDLEAEKSDVTVAQQKPVSKTKVEQNLVNAKASKEAQVADVNGPLRSEIKAISAPVVTTQATVVKQGAELASQVAPVQAEIANQMKRSQESKAAESNVDLEGLDDQLEETVIQSRPQKSAPTVEPRILRNAQIEAALPLAAEFTEASETTEAEQALSEIMAPVSAGSAQLQTVAVSAANTATPSQNLAALERWSNSIVDVQKQGWTQSLVRRVASMPTNGGNLVITLQPASLGKITVSLSESRRGMDLRMRTETGATAALLNDAEGRISQLLESAGMRLNSFSADTSGSFAENDNNADKSDTPKQNDLDFAQELPENVEQSIALRGDGLVNVIA
ncbi:flagellar hook-length control protein FliK [Rhodobacteraceae bacterium]|nr:flagellar hook-length control protein FliK [Paracoccaceae bacterium]